MLEARSQIKLAGQDLDGLFHNRRVNAAGASMFIGLLPSAAAMLLCGNIVKEATEGYLKPREQAFVTSWFRHIPESTPSDLCRSSVDGKSFWGSSWKIYVGNVDSYASSRNIGIFSLPASAAERSWY